MADDNSVYRDLFFEESDDNLQTLNDSILELEQEPDNIDLINSIFRVAHTLKGMSATMGYDVMTKLTHKMEDMFDLFKTGKMKINTDHISLVFKCLDKLLQVPSSSSDKKYAIIVKIGKQYYGVLVDKMVGQQEIVIKKIDPMLQKIKKYQGATILGNGSIALILDVNAICNSRQ